MLTMAEMQLVMLALKVAHDGLDVKFGKMVEEQQRAAQEQQRASHQAQDDAVEGEILLADSAT